MYLKTLNPTQLEAATFGEAPLLILAGAGSGKTRVLTARIAYLVKEMGVEPDNILAVTFTNKAAKEMRERLGALIGAKAASLWLGTFHSIGLRILRSEARGAALTVYDDGEQLSLIKEVMEDLKMDSKALSPRAVLQRIEHAKHEQLGPAEFLSAHRDFFAERVHRIYQAYQRRLAEAGALDFGDLIVKPIEVLKNNPEALKRYRERFRHVLVDEYQDTNKSQYILTRLLSSGTRSVFAVGDPDQSIYAWRGADISNILAFEKDYPDSSVLKLEQNYRSTKSILSAANSVIARNTKRMKKELWTENADGHSVVYEEADDEYREADLVIRNVRKYLDAGGRARYSDVAVFYRTNAQSRVFEERLIREGMPYAILGGTRFYDRKEIRDAVAYLKTASNPADTVSLQRVINNPPRKIGKATYDKVIALGREKGVAPLEAIRYAVEDGLLEKTGAASFIQAMDAFRAALGSSPVNEAALKLLEDAGYMRALQAEGTEEAFDRIANIFEFISAIKDFEAANPGSTLQDFLDHTALISDVDSYEEKSDRITLMTLHSAKGLEFKFVFMTGMEEGLFPHSRSLDDPSELEEERRLCYVGMTRAMERLFLSSARSRTVYGSSRAESRSRFIDEVAPEHIEIIEPEYARPARAAAGTRFTSNEVYYTSDDGQLDAPFAGGRRGPGAGRSDQEASGPDWRVGMMVKHPLFGIGVVKEKSGRGADAKLTVNFKDAGVKKLAVKYASLTALG